MVHTSADDLLLDIPLAHHCEKECHRVHNGYRQAELCMRSVLRSPLGEGFAACLKTEATPGHQLTSLPNQEEEPHTPGEIQQQRHCISWVPQQIDHGKEGAVHFALDPAVLDPRVVQRRMRGRVVRARRAPDEGCGEAPGEPDEDEAEDVVEDGWFLLGHCE